MVNSDVERITWDREEEEKLSRGRREKGALDCEKLAFPL